MITIRPEEPPDDPAAARAQPAAFAPSALEAEIVDALRAAGDHVPELCLVAQDDDGTITGHVMLSRGTSKYPALGLGPIAVDPPPERGDRPR